MAPDTSTVVVEAETKIPSLLDQSQVDKASQALLKHISQKKTTDSKDLLEAGNEGDSINAVPIWLVINTKKLIVGKNKLKPGKIAIPHTLNRPNASICLITADPQRAFKDVIEEEAFPATLRAQIRVLGLLKLKQRYKSFEQKRQLIAEYDIFLADDRIITNLPALLGKTAYQSSKKPIPINLKPAIEQKERKIPGKKVSKDLSQRKTLPATTMAKRITGALCSARVYLTPSATTSIHVGFSHFEPEQLDQNISAVVDGMAEKFIPKGWKNVKSIFIKGPETAALPIWQTKELWTEDEQVLEDQDAETARNWPQMVANKKREEKKLAKKKLAEEWREMKRQEVKLDSNGEVYQNREQRRKLAKEMKRRRKSVGDESGFSPEMSARRDALRKQKREADEAPSVEAPSTKKAKVSKTTESSNGGLRSKSKRSRTSLIAKGSG